MHQRRRIAALWTTALHQFRDHVHASIAEDDHEHD